MIRNGPVFFPLLCEKSTMKHLSKKSSPPSLSRSFPKSVLSGLLSLPRNRTRTSEPSLFQATGPGKNPDTSALCLPVFRFAQPDQAKYPYKPNFRSVSRGVRPTYRPEQRKNPPVDIPGVCTYSIPKPGRAISRAGEEASADVGRKNRRRSSVPPPGGKGGRT